MVRLARLGMPLRRVDQREESIAGKCRINLGHDQSICPCDGIAIDLRATDDEDFTLAGGIDCVIKRIHRLNTSMRPGRIAGHHYIASVGQRATNSVEGLATHDDGVTGGDALEERQIFRQSPRQCVIDTDTVVAVGSDDERERFIHWDSDSNRRFNGRMRLVADDLDIFKAIVENIIRLTLEV